MKSFSVQLFTRVLTALCCLGWQPQAQVFAIDVCVSYRGNGPKFPSLLGQTAALIEAGFRPRVSAGGSSGANVAALVQSLLENPSVNAARSDDRTPAAVLRASKSLLDTFIFLPRFDRPDVFIRSLISYLDGQLHGDRVAGPAEFSLAHADHALAQVLMFADFFKNEDFSTISGLPGDDARTEFVQDAFFIASGALRTSPAFLMRTLLPAHEDDVNHADAHEIRTRLSGYLMLGTSSADNPDSADAQKLHPWNTLHWMIKLNPQQQARVRNFVWELLRKSSFFPGLPMTEDKTLHLPSPDALRKVLRLESNYFGRTLEIPAGLITHATAFQGNRPSADNLRQFYFAGRLTHADLRSQWAANGGRLPAMTFGGSDVPRSVIAPEKIWVARNSYSLAEILRATIAEPLLFERRTIPLSFEEKIELGQGSQQEWTANGGWLDTASYPLLRSLPQCRGLPVVLVTPRDGINSFQKQTLRGLLDLPKPQKGQPDPLFATRLFTNLDMFLKEVISNNPDRIILDFDWDDALQKRPQGATSLRAFLFDASRHHAAKILRGGK